MCEIQFIKKIDKSNITDLDIQNFTKMMEIGSISNPDAFGLFNSLCLFKKKGLVNLKGLDKDLLKADNFIIGHNRFATGGDHRLNYNNHPFILDKFVMVHNGIISNSNILNYDFKIDSKIDTDSFSVLHLIVNFFNKMQKGSRRNKMVKAIRKTTKLISGSYSIFIYDKETRDLFYFKNDKTSFYFYNINNKVLIGTTDNKKVYYLYQNLEEYNKKEEIKIKDNNIYLINEKSLVKCLDSFKENEEEDKGLSYSQFEKLDWDSIDKIFIDYLGYVPKYEMNNQEVIIKENQDDVYSCFGDEICIKDEDTGDLLFDLDAFFERYYIY